MTEKQFYRELGRKIGDRRKEAGLKQDEVARAIGLARASLANIESGRQRIMVYQLFKLVEALRLNSVLELVPATWHFDDQEDAKPELELRLALVASDDNSERGKLQLLTDDQQVRVHNLVRAALASGKRGKRT